jgi:hypothetical protein
MPACRCRTGPGNPGGTVLSVKAMDAMCRY